MKTPGTARSVGAAAIKIALLAAALMFVSTTSQADPDGGRQSGRGGRSRDGGSERQYGRGDNQSRRGGGDRSSVGNERRYKNGGGSQGGGGDRAYRGGGGRNGADRGAPAYGGNGRNYADRGGPAYGGGGRNYGGGSAWRGSQRHPGGGSYYGGGNYYGGGGYYGGAPYRSRVVRYVHPYRYGYAGPRSYVSFGIGLGVPYYCPPAYRRSLAPLPVVVAPSDQVDVENLPPAGCYYYDPFCDRQFVDLDTYTDHIDQENHAKTIEIIDRDSGDLVRTLEFVDGYWSAQP